MATPTLVTIDGVFSPATRSRRVRFQQSVAVRYGAGPDVLLPQTFETTVNQTDGTFQIIVPGSNDPAWSPTNWTYRVFVEGDDLNYYFDTVVPYDTTPINFSILLPALTPSQGALYAPIGHTHAGGGGGGSTAWADITGKPATFTPSTHTHAITDVTNLQTTLNGKAATAHTHVIADTTNLQTTLDGKAAASHSHSYEAVGTAAAAVTAHEGASDPHPQYLTATEGTAAYQPLDTDLTTIAGLTATTDNFIVSVSNAWASRTPAQVKTTLALNNVNNTSDANKPVSTAQATAIADGDAAVLFTASEAYDAAAAAITAIAALTKVLVLAAADPIPGGTAAGTVIVRY